MFGKKKKNELDIEGINDIISISNRILKVSFTVVIISLAVLILYLLRTLNIFGILKDVIIVISPVFIGLVIAWLFDPLVDFFERRKFPRLAGCIIVYVVFIGLLSFLIFLMAPSFIDQIKDFVTSMPSLLSELKKFISGMLTSFSHGTDIDVTVVKKQIFNTLEAFGTDMTTDLPNTIFLVGKSVISGGIFVILGIMIGFYMLYDFDKIHMGIMDLLPKTWYDNADDLANRINHSLREYVMGLLTVMFLVFVTQSICLTIAGLKAPLIFALFCAVTDVIPYFGPYIGAIPAVLVGFSISPFTGICCIIGIVIVQLLENNFYQPLIMGHAMKLHPVTIILGLLLFQHFFGIIGMIIATPVISTIKIIFTFIDEKIEVIKKIKEN